MFLLDAPVTGKRQVALGMFVIGMRVPEIAETVSHLLRKSRALAHPAGTAHNA